MYLYALIYLISLMIFKMGSTPAKIRYFLLAFGIIVNFIFIVICALLLVIYLNQLDSINVLYIMFRSYQM